MTAPTTFIAIGTWLTSEELPATGQVSFYAAEPRWINNGNILEAETIRVVLDKNGQINKTLVRCPSGYIVNEDLIGLEDSLYAIGDQPGTIDLQTTGPTGPVGPGPARLTVSPADQPPTSPRPNDLWVRI